MILPRRRAVLAALAAAGLATTATAQSPETAAADPRIAADGTVTMDGVRVPLPALASPEGRDYLRHLILDKPFGTPVPDLAEERARQDQIMFDFLEPMRARYAVAIEEQTIGGIVTDVVTPTAGIAPENEDRVLINLHGGGFVTGARSASLVESVPLAALMRIKVVSVDYRMGPEHRFPAGSEDAAVVYRELLKTYAPENIGIYGCSAGGLLAAQAVAWFKANDLPDPGALGVFCASFTGFFGGDSVALSGPLNGMLPPLDPPPGPRLAGGGGGGMVYLDTARADDPLAYPQASPELLASFPPTLFITGTRSFEFGAALTSHNRLTQAGGTSSFHGWDGMFHGFIYNSELPEAREAYRIMADFFDSNLGR